MTMLKKTTYTIDGEELQKRISSEIDSVKHCYCKWNDPGSENADFYYMLFKKHYGVLRMLLAIQGNSDSEVAMIMNYMKDLAYRESIRCKINSLDAEIDALGTRCMKSSKHSKSKTTAKAKSRGIMQSKPSATN